jgi:dihydroorotate dehydrogenase electron transfer subunit
MIFTEDCNIRQCTEVGKNIYVLSFHSPAIAMAAKAGQFVNIKADNSCDPLLRRPFSIYRISGEHIEIIFNIVGKGTYLLAHKKPGDLINVIGPLGVPYTAEDTYGTALLISGGLGIAPMPFLTNTLQKIEKPLINFVGARSKELLVLSHLSNVNIATDDGSEGFHGSVVKCAEEYCNTHEVVLPKIFACGPNRMLEAVSDFAAKNNIPCEVSLECAMACGIGICQGCPVEMAEGSRKYNLVCKDGPTFDTRKINIESLISH